VAGDGIATQKPQGPPPSQIQTISPKVSFQTDNVPPSQYVYFRDAEYLNLVTLTNLTGQQVVFRARFLTPQNEIKETTFTTPLLTAGILQLFQVPVAEGWLISLAVQCFTGNTPGNWVFAQILTGRSALFQQLSLGLIWQGYVPFGSANGWPGNPSKEPTDGPGRLRSITGSTPAPGVEISEIVGNQRRWNLLSLSATLTTNATVANRFPGFALDDGTNSLWFIRSNTAQVAGSFQGYKAGPGSQFYNDTQNNTIIPFPSPSLLSSGFHIKSTTVGLQAGDQWSAPQYLVQEWGVLDN